MLKGGKPTQLHPTLLHVFQDPYQLTFWFPSLSSYNYNIQGHLLSQRTDEKQLQTNNLNICQIRLMERQRRISLLIILNGKCKFVYSFSIEKRKLPPIPNETDVRKSWQKSPPFSADLKQLACSILDNPIFSTGSYTWAVQHIKMFTGYIKTKDVFCYFWSDRNPKVTKTLLFPLGGPKSLGATGKQHCA